MVGIFLMTARAVSGGIRDWKMNFSLRRLPRWPLALAAIFFAISMLLAVSYPSSFWMITDYQPHGLANALNMAYRLADRQMYLAEGLAYHPGVPFYLMSWLALAVTGHPVATADLGFFNMVIAHVDEYHRASLFLFALVGAAGVYIFARAAQTLVPIGVTIIGLSAWLVSTPATLLTFMSPSIDSFALMINALFFAVMVPLAYEKKTDPGIIVLAACVGAFAYLNKLSYIYIPVALLAAILIKLVFGRAGWLRSPLLILLFMLVLCSFTLAVALNIIGWEGFVKVLEYHQSVIVGSELYGIGDQTVVSKHEIWRAIMTIPGDRAYAVPIALIAGTALGIGGLVTLLKRDEQSPVAVISIGTGVTAVLSALSVLKHYNIHYTAGVSATLPACIVCCYLLARSWGLRLRTVGAAVATIAILFLAFQMKGPLIYTLAGRTEASRLAVADLEELNSYLAANKGTVEFAYRAPFAQYGEGFVVIFASVPRLTYDYLRSGRQTISSMVAGLITRDIGAYVIDKSYFRDVESVKAAPNVALQDPKPVKFQESDTLIELRTVFLLVRK
jgi:hypothetical protein